jgi:hypothetical protein
VTYAWKHVYSVLLYDWFYIHHAFIVALFGLNFMNKLNKLNGVTSQKTGILQIVRSLWAILARIRRCSTYRAVSMDLYLPWLWNRIDVYAESYISMLDMLFVYNTVLHNPKSKTGNTGICEAQVVIFHSSHFCYYTYFDLAKRMFVEDLIKLAAVCGSDSASVTPTTSCPFFGSLLVSYTQR